MEFALQHFLHVFLPAIGGGLIQGMTGFGSGIFVMMFFPLFLPVLQSSALSTLNSISVSLPLAWKYRAYIQPKIIVLPALFYVTAAFFAIRFAVQADLTALKSFLGLFLMLVALYFLFVAGKLKIKATFWTALICGTLAGASSGLFGIGGPPMVIYILAITGDDKEAYIANSQFFFTVTMLFTTTMRVINGIITPGLLFLMIPGILGMTIGKNFGLRIVERIDVDKMKKIIYVFLFLSGLSTFLTNL